MKDIVKKEVHSYIQNRIKNCVLWTQTLSGFPLPSMKENQLCALLFPANRQNTVLLQTTRWLFAVREFQSSRLSVWLKVKHPNFTTNHFLCNTFHKFSVLGFRSSMVSLLINIEVYLVFIFSEHISDYFRNAMWRIWYNLRKRYSFNEWHSYQNMLCLVL